MISIVGLGGFIITKINPNIVVPAEPSKDYLELNTHLSAELYVIITRPVIMDFDPSILEEHNMTGWFYCIIKTPENSLWDVSEIDTSTISLNSKINPCSTSIHFDINETAFLLAKFEKTLLACVFENQDSREHEAVTLSISGRLKNGDLFAGNNKVQII
jgi:hypothetical protein